METTTEKFTHEDYMALDALVDRNQRWTWKMVKYAAVLFGFPLFVPIGILDMCSRSSRPLERQSPFLFFEFGAMNVLLFIVLPVAIIIFLLYLLWLKVPLMKRDLRNENKIIVEIKVAEVNELQGQEKKDLWMFSHKIRFEPNLYGYDEEIFQSREKPHFLTAKAFRMHLTEHARAELRRETISE